MGERILRRSMVLRPVGRDDLAARQLVADEQAVDDRVDLLLVHQEDAAPPALELQEAGLLGVDLGPEIVVLAPVAYWPGSGSRNSHQIGAVEPAIAKVAGEQCRPGTAGQAAGVAHRVRSLDAGPVRQRRARQDDRPHHLRPCGAQDRDRPAGLAIAVDAGLVAVGMKLAHPLDEARFGDATSPASGPARVRGRR